MLCAGDRWLIHFQGKFSQRNNLGHSVVLRSPAEFYRLVYDHRVEIKHIIPVSDQAIRLQYMDKADFVQEGKNSNIVISLWTTSLLFL